MEQSGRDDGLSKYFSKTMMKYHQSLWYFAHIHHCACHDTKGKDAASNNCLYGIRMSQAAGTTSWEEIGEGKDEHPKLAAAMAMVDLLGKLFPHFAMAGDMRCQDVECLRKIMLGVMEVECTLMHIYQQKAERMERALAAKQQRLQQIKQQGRIHFGKSSYTLSVGKSAKYCESRKHQVIDVTGVISDLQGKPIYLSVNYCAECQQFFIGQQEFSHYQKKYGPMLGRFDFLRQEHVETNTEAFGQLGAESVLRQCGYTVKSNDLKRTERRKILANVIDCGILSKGTIIDYIQCFINSHKKQPRMAQAIAKWESDMDWVANYHLDKQQKFKIGSVQHARSRFA